MATFTICYSGTDCYLDQALVLRKAEEMKSYNEYSGYIPSKIYNLLSQNFDKGVSSVTLNGPGEPYGTNYKSLPVRVWSIEERELEPVFGTSEYYSDCSYAPAYLGDSALGNSMEAIAVAGLAEMLSVTLHMVPRGQYNEIMEYWNPETSMGYSKSALQYPLQDTRWNKVEQSTAGYYCLRWSEADNEKIQAFIKDFTQVVLLGHSRGGVECIIAANYLAEWFPKLSIKVATLDPVPGSGDWWSVITHIPAVKNLEYVGVYAIDETSAGFNGVVPRVKGLDSADKVCVWDPLDPNSSQSQIKGWTNGKYELLYTRGRHATVPGSRTSYGKADSDDYNNNVGASGNLTNALIINKLIDWGVVGLKAASKQEIKQWIAQMEGAYNHFAEMRNYNYGKFGIPLTGLFNGFAYYRARGISSSSGRLQGDWNYLEAFITYVTKQDTNGDQQAADLKNNQRGLITQGIRTDYYPSLGATGKVQSWFFVGDVF